MKQIKKQKNNQNSGSGGKPGSGAGAGIGAGPVPNNPKIQNVAINLKGFINLVQRNSKAIQVATSVSNYNSIPSKSFWLSVDKNLPFEIPQQF